MKACGSSSNNDIERIKNINHYVAIILKNNVPRYVIIEFSQYQSMQFASTVVGLS